jgi:aminoglycoside phosphotransferase (APT) family kinase protein
VSGARQPPSPEQIARLLGPYLSERLGTPVRLAGAPEEITGGWDTYIFVFRLAPGDGGLPLPPELLERDLILRIYQGDAGLAKGEREFRVQTRLAEAGYPAPKPFLLETDRSLLGQAFMVMEKLPGRTMMDVMASSGPVTALRMMKLLADTHTRLHDLDGVRLGLAEPDARSQLENALRGARRLIEEDGVRALAPVVSWVEDRRSELPQEGSSVLHLDFHPLNVLVHEGEVSGVIDWPNATVGDAYVDVASTVTLLTTAPAGDVPAWARVLLPAVRRTLVNRYLSHYGRKRPLDRRRLRLYEVVAGLEWLVHSQLFRYVRPEELGVKLESAAMVSQRDVNALCRFIGQRTGLRLEISIADLRRAGTRDGSSR